MFARLINADPFEVDPDFAPSRGLPVAVTPLGQVFIPLEGFVDLSAEKERLAKEIGKLETELETVRKKLSNESFVARAPAAIVAEHRQREVDFLRKLEQLRERVAGSLTLGGLSSNEMRRGIFLFCNPEVSCILPFFC